MFAPSLCSNGCGLRFTSGSVHEHLTGRDKRRSSVTSRSDAVRMSARNRTRSNAPTFYRPVCSTEKYMRPYRPVEILYSLGHSMRAEWERKFRPLPLRSHALDYSGNESDISDSDDSCKKISDHRAHSTLITSLEINKEPEQKTA